MWDIERKKKHEKEVENLKKKEGTMGKIWHWCNLFFYKYFPSKFYHEKNNL